ncbi:MAG: putative sporulation protein YtxC [Bacillota bacterium]|nr:putative sporulation protein YtxC [Bacillota bacterium]
MESITIGTVDNPDSVRSRLTSELRLLQEEEGFRITIAERGRGKLTFLGCNLESAGNRGGGNPLEVFRYYVARALADLIVNEVTQQTLPKILHRNYSQFGEEDQDDILARARSLLEASTDPDGRGLVRQINRRNQILFRLLEFLDLHDELVVEGFLRFRLKEYFRELVEIIDRAVEAFMADREYREFVRLLRYFVELQEPRQEEVHVIVRPEGLYRLLDREDRVVENDYLEGPVVKMVQEEINQDDLLLSALITLAPRRIVLHLDSSSRVAETIRSVFGERAEMCPGCRRCAAERLAEKGVDTVDPHGYNKENAGNGDDEDE